MSKKDPYLKTSRNNRKQTHKYYYMNDVHRLAVKAGRCYKCNKITDSYCDKCSRWVCDNHKVKPDKEDYTCYCLDCE